MLPLSRNETLKTPGINDRKTPFKMQPPKYAGTASKQTMNRSCLFNTPAVNSSTLKTVRRQTEIPATSEMNFTQQSIAESIDNNTFSVMNISTSTEVDMSAPATPAAVSFSPFMRQIEKTIDQKFASFMENFQSQSMMINSQFQHTMKRNLMAAAVESFTTEDGDLNSVSLSRLFTFI